MFELRYCDTCGIKLSRNDDKYEVIKITFSQAKGLSRNIVEKYCKKCYEGRR